MCTRDYLCLLPAVTDRIRIEGILYGAWDFKIPQKKGRNRANEGLGIVKYYDILPDTNCISNDMN